MDKLISLYQELSAQGITFYTWDLDGGKAATLEVNGRYAIFMDVDHIHTTAEERVILAHEGGHAVTGATHRLSSPFDLIAKHEYQANKWAFKKLLPPEELDQAVRAGYTEPWQLADYFQLPESFVVRAIAYYRMLQS